MTDRPRVERMPRSPHSNCATHSAPVPRTASEPPGHPAPAATRRRPPHIENGPCPRARVGRRSAAAHGPWPRPPISQAQKGKGVALLKAIDTNPSFAPRESGPLPERLISGDPAFGPGPRTSPLGSRSIRAFGSDAGRISWTRGRAFDSATSSPASSNSTREGSETVIYKASDSSSHEPATSAS